MKNELQQQVINAVHSPKIEAAVSTVTIAAGVGALLNYLPDLLGCVGLVVGIFLTGVLIKRGRLESKKIQLEIDLLKDREAERLKERQDSGQPCRRGGDKPLT